MAHWIMVVTKDGLQDYRKEWDDTISPPIPPVHTCPAGSHWDASQGACVLDSPPPPPPPPIEGEKWVWGKYPEVTLNKDQTKTYIVHLDTPNTLVIRANGQSMKTDGTFTWRLPDGTILNAMSPMKGVNTAGLLKIKSAPAGDHVWTLISNVDGTQVKLQLDKQ